MPTVDNISKAVVEFTAATPPVGDIHRTITQLSEKTRSKRNVRATKRGHLQFYDWLPSAIVVLVQLLGA